MSFFDTTKMPADSFQALIGQCESLISAAGYGQIPDKANIQYVHSIRNDAQHKVKYPDENTVNDCRTYTRDFHNKLLTQLWDLSIEKISLVEMVQHPEIKKYLVNAETSLNKSSYKEAAEQAATGLYLAIGYVENAFVGKEHHFIDGFLTADHGGKPEVNKDIYKTFKRMQETLLYLALGMNYADYRRYLSVAGMTSMTMDGSHHHINMKDPLQPEDAQFIVTYATDTIVQIETIVGSLDAPFGVERWSWF